MVDENRQLTQVWWQFFLTMFNKLGGSGSNPDLSAIVAQLNATTAATDYQSVIPTDPGVREALRRIEELASLIQESADASVRQALQRIEEIAAQQQDQPSMTATLGKLAEIESWVMGANPAPVFPTPEAFIAPTLINSWVNSGAPFNPAGYYKDPFGIVHLRGLVKSGTVGTDIFTLPVGYRPANTEVLACVSNGAFGVIEPSAAGGVNATVGNNAYFSLDGLTFRAA